MTRRIVTIVDAPPDPHRYAEHVQAQCPHCGLRLVIEIPPGGSDLVCVRCGATFGRAYLEGDEE